MYTVSQLAALPEAKVGSEAIRKRLVVQKMSTEDAVNTPYIAGHPFQYAYRGGTYTIPQLAEHPDCKVSVDSLRGRILRLKWPVERAMHTPPMVVGQNAARSVKCLRFSFPSIAQMCVTMELDPREAGPRIRDGESPTDIFLEKYPRLAKPGTGWGW